LRRRAESRPAARRPALTVLTALLFAALAATGCVSMPSGGPVLSYPVTQGAAAQNQPYVQIQPQPPRAGWSPSEIVQGFLTASANFGNYPEVARAYLTPDERDSWDPFWSAAVYKSGPNVTSATYPSPAKNAKTATVRITGTIQANLLGNGVYSVPSASAPGGSSAPPQTFKLTKVDGQWRISSAPPKLLLTSNSFENDYQLRNLYYFDPLGKFLVPDPVYVPLRGDLMDGLVNELISPPPDWLSFGATTTAFPAKTKVSGVVLDGGVTAVVNLTGAAIGKASADVMQRVSAQLLLTLSGAVPSVSNGQAVQSVEVVVNGKPWSPPGSQSNNPVQTKPNWKPATGASTEFYSVDSKGFLTRRAKAGGKPVTMTRVGTGSQVAVSADGAYLAVLHDGTLSTGSPAGGPLTKRGAGFVAMSWDANDDLWASEGDQIVVFRGTSNPRQPLGQMVPVEVEGAPVTGKYTQLQVAPDGVRVAVVSGGDGLAFGAISRQQGQTVLTFSQVLQTPLTQVTVPDNANFTALTWYGPDNVITLATPGPSVTEYPVSGATPTAIQAEGGMESITASWKQPLIAGLQNGSLVADPNITGSWTPINDGDTPADGSSPVYPG
jgi:Lipoprotein LpqB beta-propeller domain/Sporulation and spore germination